MTILILGLILFFIPHCVSIVSADWRDAQVRRWGELTWKAGYSLVAAVGLALIIWGYGVARQSPVVVWLPPEWLRHLALLLMLPVFPLLVAAYVPSRLGTLARHPMLVAVKLWALAHLLVNGMLADLLLFGSFLVWAVVDRISLKRRRPRATPRVPLSRGGDLVAIGAGLALYVAFVFWLHASLIGRPLVG